MPSEADHIKAVQAPGRYNATVSSEDEARRIVQRALPHAAEVSPGIRGQPDPIPAPGVRAWYQVQPAEPDVGNMFPHVKYEDWTGGKKFQGGRWGHLFFPEPESEKRTMSYMFEVLSKSPLDSRREAALSASVAELGGHLTAREEPDQVGTGPVSLTFEFAELRVAESTASCLRSRGEHVEGPVDYGESLAQLEKEEHAMEFTRITYDPAVMGGKPCIRGMRVTVSMVLGLLASGETRERILEDFLYLEPEDIDEVLAYAAWRLQERDEEVSVA